MRVVLAVLFFLATVVGAGAWTHGNPNAVGGACPYADQASSDGCSAAIAAIGSGLSGASVQHTNFFQGYGQQEGQTYYEGSFTGSISGGVLTVSGCSSACLKNPTIFETIQCTNGSGTQGACSTSGTLPAGVRISSLGSGTGGNGTYNLANASGVTASGTMQGLIRPYWNVAGVEYAIGVAAGVTLKDPATMGVCPTPNSGDNICADRFRTGSNNFNVAYVSGANPTVQGWDFTQEGGWMVVFTFNTDTNGSSPGNIGAGFVPPSGAVTFKNNKMAPGTTFQVGGELGNYCAAEIGLSQACGLFSETASEGSCVSGCITNYLFTQNYLDGLAGEGSNAGSSLYLIGQICGGTGLSGMLGNVLGSSGPNPTFTYDAIINWNSRCNLGWSMTLNNSYMENINYNSTAHGELTSLSTGHTNQATVVPLAEVNYNTILEPATSCGGATTFIWLTSGGASQSYSDVEVNNNSVVGNGCALSVTANTSASSTSCVGTSADGAGCQVTIDTPQAWAVISNLSNNKLNLFGQFSSTANPSLTQAYMTSATWDTVNNYLTVTTLGSGADIEAGDQIQLAAGFGVDSTGQQNDLPAPALPFPHGNAIVFGGTGCPGATACTGTGGTGTYTMTGMSTALSGATNTQILAFKGGTGPAQNGVYRWVCVSGNGCSMPIAAAPTTIYISTLPGGSTPISGGPGAGGTITLWNCNNNYYDPLANGNPHPTYLNFCGNNVTPGTYNHTGGINMLNGAGL